MTQKSTRQGNTDNKKCNIKAKNKQKHNEVTIQACEGEMWGNEKKKILGKNSKMGGGERETFS